MGRFIGMLALALVLSVGMSPAMTFAADPPPPTTDDKGKDKKPDGPKLSATDEKKDEKKDDKGGK